MGVGVKEQTFRVIVGLGNVNKQLKKWEVL
jgi:hypothetical protein